MERPGAIRREECGSIKDLAVQVCGVEAYLGRHSPEGSDIEYGHLTPDLSTAQDRVKIILDEKAPKLKRYKQEGLETWLVVYNTMWMVKDARPVIECLLGAAEHNHVDHVGIICGGVDLPYDAWVDVVR